MVVGGDSCPRGCEFESQYGILPRWIIFHIYPFVVKLFGLFDKSKNKQKEDGNGQFSSKYHVRGTVDKVVADDTSGQHFKGKVQSSATYLFQNIAFLPIENLKKWLWHYLTLTTTKRPIHCNWNILTGSGGCGTLVNWSLSIPEIYGSNPVHATFPSILSTNLALKIAPGIAHLKTIVPIPRFIFIHLKKVKCFDKFGINLTVFY